MSLIKISNNAYPRTIADVKREFPNVSFPNTMTDAQLLPYGYANVVNTAKPTYDVNTQTVSEITPVSNGTIYEQQWAVTTHDAQWIADTLEANLDSAQATLDDDVEGYILSYWSANSQRNAGLGIMEQVKSDLCKQEVGDTLAQNVGYVHGLNSLTSQEDITAYMQSLQELDASGNVVRNIARLAITGGQ